MDSPWQKHVSYIGKVLRNASLAYLSSNPDNDIEKDIYGDNLFMSGSRKSIPIIPDVTLHYRCGDNIAGASSAIGYGLLKVKDIVSRIPVNARHIYILAESTSRNKKKSTHGCNDECSLIHYFVYKSLIKKFPKSLVVLKKGGNIYLDFVRLVLSNTTICSASTFCFYAALGHNQSAVYFPRTKLIANPLESSFSNIELGQSFVWMPITVTLNSTLSGISDELLSCGFENGMLSSFSKQIICL